MSEDAALREAVRLAAMKVLYTRELQVRSGLGCKVFGFVVSGVNERAKAVFRWAVWLAAIKMLHTREQALEDALSAPNLLQQLHQRTEALRSARLEEPRLRLAVEGFSAADWNSIAADMACGRSGGELARHWACSLSEAALRDWSAGELLRLGELVKQHGTSNWALVAQELGTNRPPGVVVKAWVAECAGRAAQTAPSRLKKQEMLQLTYGSDAQQQQQQWLQDGDAEEVMALIAQASGDVSDAAALQQQQQQQQQQQWRHGSSGDADLEKRQLVALVGQHGKNWRVVGRAMGKSPSQAGKMYKSMLESVSRANSGPWTDQEDVMLLRAVHSHGTKWRDIEQLGVLPGRTARQMKEHFASVLDPAVDHSPMGAEEIVILQQQAEAHSATFGSVLWDKLAAEHFGGRRKPAKLRTVYGMLQKAGGDVQLVLQHQASLPGRPRRGCKQKSVAWSIEEVLGVFPTAYVVVPSVGGVHRCSTWEAYAQSPDTRSKHGSIWVSWPDRPVMPTPEQHQAFLQWLGEKQQEQAAWQASLLARYAVGAGAGLQLYRKRAPHQRSPPGGQAQQQALLQ
ncbi:hypothetical protein OEZ86_013349 [Tetradesmus obliquus]|nr:hypothetical protein OEZ86_013349 [Tetradesmus obliquus]